MMFFLLLWTVSCNDRLNTERISPTDRTVSLSPGGVGGAASSRLIMQLQCCFRLLSFFLLALGSFASLADDSINMFVDTDGVTHLSNIPNQKYFNVQPALPLQKGRSDVSGVRQLSVLPLEQRPFHEQVTRASKDTGLDSALLHAVISVESGYNNVAVSTKGARGLMQLLPATARRYGASNLFDPAENIGAGARYLRDLMRLFNNDLELSLAAYNAGENAILRHGNKVPPYTETRRYVPLVLNRYRYFSNLGGARTFVQ